MTNAIPTLRSRVLRAVVTLAAIVAVPAPAFAQDAGDEARLRKLEAEVRALQRKVFPGGDGRFFEPQIGTGAQTPANNGQVMGVIPPATTAVTDILVRLDALEAQLQTLTARSEEQANALSQMEMRLAALETGAAAEDSPPTAALPVATSQSATPPFSRSLRY